MVQFKVKLRPLAHNGYNMYRQYAKKKINSLDNITRPIILAGNNMFSVGYNLISIYCLYEIQSLTV
jgi:hypothetical protein